MQNRLRISAWRMCHVALFLVLSIQALSADERENLTGGWGHDAPYSYTEMVQGFQHWRGFDVELLREIADRAGYVVESPRIEWTEQLRLIESGEIDIAAAAARTPEREEFAHFSVPYRGETMVLIMPRGRSADLPATSDVELVELFKEKNFRLGVGAGIAYPSDAMRRYLADPANADQIYAVDSEQALHQDLIDGRTDGYISDRIVAATFIGASGVRADFEEHPVRIEGDLHLMFSKATVSAETVADFNRAIENVHEDGTFRQLNEIYAFPILVVLTLDSYWFFAVDIIGTIAFTISGLLLAFRYNYDIFGALVLGALPAVGGGAVRDLLTNRDTLAALSNPIYIEIVVALVVGGYLLIHAGMALKRCGAASAVLGFVNRSCGHVGYFVQMFDAAGLAAFTVTGVVVAVGTQSAPLWLWGPILAALTAAGGGILRDVVRSDPEIPSLKGELYPEIAVVWGLILSLYFDWQARHLNADAISIGIVATFIGAFLTRMLVIHFGIRSPRFSARS